MFTRQNGVGFSPSVAVIVSIAVATAGHADEPAATIGPDGGSRQEEAAELGDAAGGVTVASKGVGVDVESAKLDAITT